MQLLLLAKQKCFQITEYYTLKKTLWHLFRDRVKLPQG